MLLWVSLRTAVISEPSCIRMGGLKTLPKQFGSGDSKKKVRKQIQRALTWS